MTALLFILPGTDWGGGWNLYTTYTNSVGFLPSALENLAIKDILVASTAGDLAADVTSASVLRRSSSSSLSQRDECWH